MTEITVVGGGLAGCEAAWQLAQRGFKVLLYEMRPEVQTGAHVTADLAELVCSNSLGSSLLDRPSGLMKQELRLLGSFLMQCADETAIPAGGALAVDRKCFAELVTKRIQQNQNIQVVRAEITEIPDGPVIIASGPLTSQKLADAIQGLTGQERLYFYDAVAPIVQAESIDHSIAFRSSRFERGDSDAGDYLNCPLDQAEYERFVGELINAERFGLKDFEKELESGVRAGAQQFFESCLPVEIIAQRGLKSLAFGPMRPIGLIDHRTGRRPYAVVQLRQEDLARTLYNLVGFQTNLTIQEQRRIFRMIPGLERAEFVRYGQMHRNTFISSPVLLHSTLQFRHREDLFFAGQITGVEGYVGNIATGLLAGINLGRVVSGCKPISLPDTTMAGALCRYIAGTDPSGFQPMKGNFGILPDLDIEERLDRRERARLYSERSLRTLRQFLDTTNN